MQFVILSGRGRFLSRHVHQVILKIIDRAMAAFSATGMNPDRYVTIYLTCIYTFAVNKSISVQLYLVESATINIYACYVVMAIGCMHVFCSMLQL